MKGFKEYLNSDAKIKKSNGDTDAIASVSALGYDCYMAFVNALESLKGDVTGEEVCKALTTLDFTGVTGRIVFDENGDAKKDAAFIETFDNGEMKLVGFQGATPDSYKDAQ